MGPAEAGPYVTRSIASLRDHSSTSRVRKTGSPLRGSCPAPRRRKRDSRQRQPAVMRSSSFVLSLCALTVHDQRQRTTLDPAQDWTSKRARLDVSSVSHPAGPQCRTLRDTSTSQEDSTRGLAAVDHV